MKDLGLYISCSPLIVRAFTVISLYMGGLIMFTTQLEILYITNNCRYLYIIGIAKVLPIIDVLDY